MWLARSHTTSTISLPAFGPQRRQVIAPPRASLVLLGTAWGPQCPDALGLASSVWRSCKMGFERRGTHIALGAEIPLPLQLQGKDFAPGGLRTPLAFPQLPAPAGAHHSDPHEKEITCSGGLLNHQAGFQTA